MALAVVRALEDRFDSGYLARERARTQGTYGIPESSSGTRCWLLDASTRDLSRSRSGLEDRFDSGYLARERARALGTLGIPKSWSGTVLLLDGHTRDLPRRPRPPAYSPHLRPLQPPSSAGTPASGTAPGPPLAIAQAPRAQAPPMQCTPAPLRPCAPAPRQPRELSHLGPQTMKGASPPGAAPSHSHEGRTPPPYAADSFALNANESSPSSPTSTLTVPPFSSAPKSSSSTRRPLILSSSRRPIGRAPKSLS